MIHPGLSPLMFATTPTLQSVNGRFEPGPGPQRTTKRVSLAGSCEAAPNYAGTSGAALFP